MIPSLPFRAGLTAFALAACSLATLVTNDTSVAANQTFDYVIVGGGLSGITVGNKVGSPQKRFRGGRADGRWQLSGEGYSVLIIEAGPDARGNPAVFNAFDRNNLVREGFSMRTRVTKIDARAGQLLQLEVYRVRRRWERASGPD